jgi:hypothetical protein
MSEFIVIAFPDEASARQGMQRLTDLRSDRRIVLHGAGLVTKDDNGNLSMQVLSDEGLTLVAAGAPLPALRIADGRPADRLCLRSDLRADARPCAFPECLEGLGRPVHAI